MTAPGMYVSQYNNNTSCRSHRLGLVGQKLPTAQRPLARCSNGSLIPFPNFLAAPAARRSFLKPSSRKKKKKRKEKL
ncbi:hypothetical protein I7I48_08891 [Histoplasma ohiense]|nr:hypothetical protein I7I48_08891 [Histoplasma ohiense (nom. inval.)]